MTARVLLRLGAVVLLMLALLLFATTEMDFVYTGF